MEHQVIKREMVCNSVKARIEYELIFKNGHPTIHNPSITIEHSLGEAKFSEVSNLPWMIDRLYSALLYSAACRSITSSSCPDSLYTVKSDDAFNEYPKLEFRVILAGLLTSKSEGERDYFKFFFDFRKSELDGLKAACRWLLSEMENIKINTIHPFHAVDPKSYSVKERSNIFRSFVERMIGEVSWCHRAAEVLGLSDEEALRSLNRGDFTKEAFHAPIKYLEECIKEKEASKSKETIAGPGDLSPHARINLAVESFKSGEIDAHELVGIICEALKEKGEIQ